MRPSSSATPSETLIPSAATEKVVRRSARMIVISVPSSVPLSFAASIYLTSGIMHLPNQDRKPKLTVGIPDLQAAHALPQGASRPSGEVLSWRDRSAHF